MISTSQMVGLLNIGTEEAKGTGTIQDAAQALCGKQMAFI